jgi:hypothetical protein
VRIELRRDETAGEWRKLRGGNFIIKFFTEYAYNQIQTFLPENPKGRYRFSGLNVALYGRIILKLILNIWGVKTGTGCNWLSMWGYWLFFVNTHTYMLRERSCICWSSDRLRTSQVVPLLNRLFSLYLLRICLTLSVLSKLDTRHRM